MFIRQLQHARSKYADDILGVIIVMAFIVGVLAITLNRVHAKAADPQEKVATRPAHGLDMLTVRTISEGENPLQLVIAISDTGAVDIEFVPQPVKVLVSQ